LPILSTVGASSTILSVMEKCVSDAKKIASASEKSVPVPQNVISTRKKILFASTTILFASKAILFASKTILSASKTILFASKTILSASKTILLRQRHSFLHQKQSSLCQRQSSLYQRQSSSHQRQSSLCWRQSFLCRGSWLVNCQSLAHKDLRLLKQSFAIQQLVVFRAPARSHHYCFGKFTVSLIALYNLTVFVLQTSCQVFLFICPFRKTRKPLQCWQSLLPFKFPRCAHIGDLRLEMSSKLLKNNSFQKYSYW
jgi:hypothetical protein